MHRTFDLPTSCLAPSWDAMAPDLSKAARCGVSHWQQIRRQNKGRVCLHRPNFGRAFYLKRLKSTPISQLSTSACLLIKLVRMVDQCICLLFCLVGAAVRSLSCSDLAGAHPAASVFTLLVATTTV